MLVEIYLLLKQKVAADNNIFSCIFGKLQTRVNVIGLLVRYTLTWRGSTVKMLFFYGLNSHNSLYSLQRFCLIKLPQAIGILQLAALPYL